MLNTTQTVKGRFPSFRSLLFAALIAALSGAKVARAQNDTGLGAGALAGNTGNYDTGSVISPSPAATRATSIPPLGRTPCTGTPLAPTIPPLEVAHSS